MLRHALETVHQAPWLTLAPGVAIFPPRRTAEKGVYVSYPLLDQHGSYWLKPGMARQEQQITVRLLQTMIGRHEEFTSGYFDAFPELHRYATTRDQGATRRLYRLASEVLQAIEAGVFPPRVG